MANVKQVGTSTAALLLAAAIGASADNAINKPSTSAQPVMLAYGPNGIVSLDVRFAIGKGKGLVKFGYAADGSFTWAPEGIAKDNPHAIKIGTAIVAFTKAVSEELEPLAATLAQ